MRIFCGLSRANFDDFTDLDLVDGSENFRNERQEECPGSASASSIGSDSSIRIRKRRHRFARNLQRRDGLIALDCWERVKKLLESCSILQMLEERLHRHS